jgi:hypothetical protein
MKSAIYQNMSMSKIKTNKYIKTILSFWGDNNLPNLNFGDYNDESEKNENRFNDDIFK